MRAALALLAAALLLTVAAAQPSIKELVYAFNPTGPTARVGDTVAVEVTVTGCSTCLVPSPANEAPALRVASCEGRTLTVTIADDGVGSFVTAPATRALASTNLTLDSNGAATFSVTSNEVRRCQWAVSVGLH
jgi:hypothetical protein